MADVQKNFKDFHEKIKLDDENDVLREKRDIVLDVLKNNIDKDVASYTTFIHGSYSMGTGIKPIDGDYDIDVGIRFSIDKDDYSDATIPKNWVFEAVDGHTKEVKFKNSCIKVQYQKSEEPIYHVDLSVYANNNSDEKMYLAKGNLNSSTENKFWEISDPTKFKDKVNERFSDSDDREQFRRCIRYLKRWKDLKFSSSGNVAPSGIALTVCAYEYLKSSYTYDYFTNTKKYNDLEALRVLVSQMISEFKTIYDENEEKYVERLVVTMPVEPNNDLLDKMTNNAILDFKDKLGMLNENLDKACEEVDPVKACEYLNRSFGDDFEIPKKETTAEYKKQAYIGNTEGA